MFPKELLKIRKSVLRKCRTGLVLVEKEILENGKCVVKVCSRLIYLVKY
jgi:hypothetical protein